MGISTSIEQFLGILDDKALRTKHNMKAQFEELVDETVEYSKKLLTGTISTKQLTSMGHPFSRRSFKPENKKARSKMLSMGRKMTGGSIKKLPINKQTGTLLKSAYLTKKTIRDEITYTFGFSAPYSGYVLGIGGTSKMVSRGYTQAIKYFYYNNARKKAFQSSR